MALLDRAKIADALTHLGQLAAADGELIELLIVGGGVMVMEFQSRPSTRDLDALVINAIDASKIRQYAQAVASQRNWPSDWLNDAAKGFLVGAIKPTAVFMASGIRVSRPALEQLLAMKLCAWRDDVDIDDARRLLLELPSSREEIWSLVEQHLQPGKELKARYAFDDLWENKR